MGPYLTGVALIDHWRAADCSALSCEAVFIRQGWGGGLRRVEEGLLGMEK